jgi:hypothetical protein
LAETAAIGSLADKVPGTFGPHTPVTAEKASCPETSRGFTQIDADKEENQRTSVVKLSFTCPETSRGFTQIDADKEENQRTSAVKLSFTLAHYVHG